jgi:hypothetical protein
VRDRRRALRAGGFDRQQNGIGARQSALRGGFANEMRSDRANLEDLRDVML